MEFRRNSKQREVILQELRKVTSHPTATTLYHIVREQLPKVSLGTVYRNLELLTKAGLIRKLNVSGKEARFDGDISHHYHLSCVICGRIDDMINPPAISIENDTVEQDGWKISDHRIGFYGTCPECRKTQESEQQIQIKNRTTPYGDHNVISRNQGSP